jgi:hypothetical protein
MVSGGYAIAVGAHTFASSTANASFVAGQYNTASANFQTVVGQFNAEENTLGAFIVGGGTGTAAANRKNTAVFTTSSIILSGSVEISGSLKVNGGEAGSAGGTTVTIADTSPTGSKSSGSLWYNPLNVGLYIQTAQPTGSTYQLLNPAPVFITGSRPLGYRNEGTLWYNPIDKGLYMQTASVSGSQYTLITPPPLTISGSVPPSGSNPSGSLWWNENDGNLYVQISSPTGSTYVPATNTVAGGNYGATYVSQQGGPLWLIQHNLNTTTPLVTVYSGSAVMIPESIVSLDANNTRITFASDVTGTAILSTGIGGMTSASFALEAVSALTASRVNPLNQPVIISGSLTVFTGSNVEFQVTNTGVKIGNQLTDRHTVTGSLNVTGSITGSLFGTSSQAVSASVSAFSAKRRPLRPRQPRLRLPREQRWQ